MEWQRILRGMFLLLAFVPALAQKKSADKAGADKKEGESLRHYADKLDFHIGAVIQGNFWEEDPKYKQVLGRDFNSAVSIVFQRFTQPERGRFNYGSMDEAMSFAKQHDMKLMGHCLVYRNATSAPWLNFNNAQCGNWSASALEQILKEHIQALVRHGGDTYYSWEVVNEPMNPTHNGCWAQVLGEEGYIVKAFQYAREANPKALLLLNETFGEEGVDKGRADAFFALVKSLKAKGAPIDVVGIEMHLEAQELHPNYLDEFKYFLNEARKLGVETHVTEMDVYQGPNGGGPNGFENQKTIFYNIAHACLKDSNCIGFITWGLGDRYTWLRTSDWKHLTDAKPLLFDDNFDKKPAYYGVLQALKEGR